MNNNSDKLALHFKYCSFIALMVIIAVSTDRWTDKAGFTTYLSNAATMTSLLLGVVAIFYSFISNDSMSRSLGSITTVSTEVRDARSQIESFVELTKTATDESAQNTRLVHDASANLSTSLTSLDETLHAISSQNEVLKTLVGNLPTRIDQLESKFVDVAKTMGEKPQKYENPGLSNDIPKQVIQRFLTRSSLSQNLLAYACVLAVASKKNLVIADFCKAVEFNTPSSYNGFLSCMFALQLCSRKLVSDQDKTYQILSAHSELTNECKKYFVSYIATDIDEPAQKSAWQKRLENVEALFS